MIEKLEKKNRFYYLADEKDPYCPHCVEVKYLAVHIHPTGELKLRRRVWNCPSCKNEFVEIEL